MTQHRKLVALTLTLVTILVLSLLDLTPKGLDTSVYGAVSALALFCGGNAAEHWSKRT